ncbi:MAG TPA: chalcone isomerase family protein [Telluria sp.]|nr:chalcone isomerase family protein [Telluria sp.]
MIALQLSGFKALLAGALLACAFSQGALAAEAGGVKFDETAKVAGKELKLNGVGVRTKFIIKVYSAGLYLPEKKTTAAEVLKLEGPRRMTLVMLREVSSESFGKAFMDGLNDNVDNAEKMKLIPQISKFGEMFAMLEALKKGDVLHLDWIPGSGTQCELNGKKIGEVVPDLAFYNAVLRIWLGDKPVDRSLKPALLGEAK